MLTYKEKHCLSYTNKFLYCMVLKLNKHGKILFYAAVTPNGAVQWQFAFVAMIKMISRKQMQPFCLYILYHSFKVISRKSLFLFIIEIQVSHTCLGLLML